MPACIPPGPSSVGESTWSRNTCAAPACLKIAYSTVFSYLPERLHNWILSPEPSELLLTLSSPCARFFCFSIKAVHVIGFTQQASSCSASINLGTSGAHFESPLYLMVC